MKKEWLKSKQGIRLDIGCGENKQANFVGMDIVKLPGVDIVHDAQKFPYPLPDNCCFQILLSNLWEHIEPKYRIQLMNELWRIMKPGGQLLIASPYYRSSFAYQDPTHYGCPTEATFAYFDERTPLYSVYKPKPWTMVRCDYAVNGVLNVVMDAVKPEPKKKGRKAA